MIDSDEIFDQVEAIVFETASDNLNHESLLLLSETPSAISFEIHENINSLWFELIPDELEGEDWVEIGVYFLKDGLQRLFARVLFNLDLEQEKTCHIEWSDVSKR